MAPRKQNRTRKQKKNKKQQKQQQQSKTCSFCKKPLKQSGGNYELATDITVGGVPMRRNTVIVFPDGSSRTAADLKKEES